MSVGIGKSALCCQLPLQFENGLRIVEVTSACWSCGKSIPSVAIDAVSHVWGKHVISIVGRGTCPSCAEISAVDMRVHDDQSVRMLFRNVWISSLDKNYTKMFKLKEKAWTMVKSALSGDEKP